MTMAVEILRCWTGAVAVDRRSCSVARAARVQAASQPTPLSSKFNLPEPALRTMANERSPLLLNALQPSSRLLWKVGAAFSEESHQLLASHG